MEPKIQVVLLDAAGKTVASGELPLSSGIMVAASVTRGGVTYIYVTPPRSSRYTSEKHPSLTKSLSSEIMSERKEHVHAQALRWLAEGYELEWKYALNPDLGYFDMDAMSRSDLVFGMEGRVFRKKESVTVRFRVVMLRHTCGIVEPEFIYTEEGAKGIENGMVPKGTAFAGWATDWIERKV